MMTASEASRDSIRTHSKSFALASRALPPEARDHAVALYAWCRRADDAVDLVGESDQPAALAALQAELDDIYGAVSLADPILRDFQATVTACAIPRRYAEDLLVGMRMDVDRTRYRTLQDLYDYCYYVAGCVGTMMCHVMGVRDDEALRNAAHLGMAMQITNICRDVEEDWGRDRLYLPDELLAEEGAGGLDERLGQAFPDDARGAVARTIERLLTIADRFYRSGDAGIYALPWRASVSIRTARSVYSAIGVRVRAQECDPLAGRAFVSMSGKLLLMGRSIGRSLLDLPGRVGSSPTRPPTRVLDYPRDVLPLEG
ncbi:MAG: phytoene/squalene synthase family protein [Gemmatimonadota bacterium]